MTSPLKGYMFDVRPTRVSLVKRPANKRKFLVTKSEEEFVMEEIIQIITDTEGDNEEALIESFKSADKDEGTIQAAVSINRLFSAFRDSLNDDDLTNIAKSLNFGVEEKVEEEIEKADDVVAEDETSEVEKAEEGTIEETTEEVSKSETDGRIAELQAKIDSLETDRRRSELRAMVAGLHVGKSEDELIDILVSVDKAGEDVSPLVETWKTASEAVSSALREIGSEMPGIVSGDTYTQVEAEVQRIVKDEGVTETKAWQLVKDRNPALIKKYYEE